MPGYSISLTMEFILADNPVVDRELPGSRRTMANNNSRDYGFQVTAERVAAILGGDPDLFDAIAMRWRDDLLRFAYHFLGNWDDAEDVAQTTLIRAYQSLRRYDTTKPFSSWLFTIHLNCCRSVWRKRKFRRLLSLPFNMESEPRIDTNFENYDTMQLIQEEVQKLSWKQQSAFVLMAIEERDSNQAGELMNCSPVTARVHLVRAKENLRKALMKLGINSES